MIEYGPFLVGEDFLPPEPKLTLETFLVKVDWRQKYRSNETWGTSLMNLLYILRPDISDIVDSKEQEFLAQKNIKGKSAPNPNGPDVSKLGKDECLNSPKYKLLLEILKTNW